jgi:hypothetical protein
MATEACQCGNSLPVVARALPMWQQAQWSVVGATRNWNRSVGIIRWRYCESIRLPYWHTGVQSGLVARPKSAPPTAKASDSAAPLPAASMPRKSMVSESTCTRTYLPDASHFSRGEPLREATERCATRQPQRNCRFGSVGERLPAGARPAQRTGAFRTANPRGQPRSSAACRGSKFPWKLPRARPPPAHTQRHGHAGAAAKTVWLRDSLLVLNSECATTAAARRCRNRRSSAKLRKRRTTSSGRALLRTTLLSESAATLRLCDFRHPVIICHVLQRCCAKGQNAERGVAPDTNSSCTPDAASDLGESHAPPFPIELN